MNEQQATDIRIEQSNLILDVIEGKIEAIDAIKDTKYWRPEASDLLLARLIPLSKHIEKKEVKEEKVVKKVAKKKNVKKPKK
jgi:hypothetical protein